MISDDDKKFNNSPEKNKLNSPNLSKEQEINGFGSENKYNIPSLETYHESIRPSPFKSDFTPTKFVDEDIFSKQVQCNRCFIWVHAFCEGMDDAQYEAVSYGTHPIWVSHSY
jgi:hypothetical protein